MRKEIEKIIKECDYEKDGYGGYLVDDTKLTDQICSLLIERFKKVKKGECYTSINRNQLIKEMKDEPRS